MYIKMLVTCLKIFWGSLIPYKRAGKIISFYIKITIFGIILRNIWSKYTPTSTKLHYFFKMFSEDLLNPVMYAHLLLFEKKLLYKKAHFSKYLKGPLQFIITLHWLHQLFWKKSTSTVFVRFLKKTVNFTRSCAFAQKAKFYALKMFLKKISRILKLPSWQHWLKLQCWICRSFNSTIMCNLTNIYIPTFSKSSLLLFHASQFCGFWRPSAVEMSDRPMSSRSNLSLSGNRGARPLSARSRSAWGDDNDDMGIDNPSKKPEGAG